MNDQRLSLQNLTIHSETRINHGYLPEACINLFAALLGIPLNWWIVRAGWQYRRSHLKGPFSTCLVLQAFCQLYGALGQTLLYMLYIFAVFSRFHVSILECSIVRRLFQGTTLPPPLSLFIVALDRFLSLRCGLKVPKWLIVSLFLLIFVYTHGVYNVLQLTGGELGSSDICSTSIVMPHAVAVRIEPVQPAMILISVLLDLMTLYFLYNYPNDHTFRFSREFWIMITFLSLLTYSLNAMLTVTFVRNFRILFFQMILRFISERTVYARRRSTISHPNRVEQQGDQL
ncbi:G-PROTEIN-RECEP-F1-2 domain-containing protein [Aphelenchoides fujianensis]|nr:G-PROTEIN-RECEP-F1-2 domain-containing protein [Aphelenchoides fujianensis]